MMKRYKRRAKFMNETLKHKQCVFQSAKHTVTRQPSRPKHAWYTYIHTYVAWKLSFKCLPHIGEFDNFNIFEFWRSGGCLMNGRFGPAMELPITNGMGLDRKRLLSLSPSAFLPFTIQLLKSEDFLKADKFAKTCHLLNRKTAFQPSLDISCIALIYRSPCLFPRVYIWVCQLYLAAE